MGKQNDHQTADNRVIITVPVVKKKFVDSDFKVSNREEFYLRRSIQDYFIKFCEGKVSESEIQNALTKDKSLIPSLTLEVEFKTGDWDTWIDKQKNQSRMGEYVVC